ncbi:MAG: HEAT repeat domain-containing protein [Caldilineales bacterium]
MSRSDEYHHTLASLDDWEPFRCAQSLPPGPRGNLELAAAAAELGRRAVRRLDGADPEQAPVNSPQEFLVFCGVLGQGPLVGRGQRDALATLRRFAGDPRWRTREAAAMALQRWGDADMDALLLRWSIGATACSWRELLRLRCASRACWLIRGTPRQPPRKPRRDHSLASRG